MLSITLWLLMSMPTVVMLLRTRSLVVVAVLVMLEMALHLEMPMHRDLAHHRVRALLLEACLPALPVALKAARLLAL